MAYAEAYRHIIGEAVIRILFRISLGVAAVGGVVAESFYTVDSGQHAVLFDRFRGVRSKTVGEGTHVLVPFIQKPCFFDLRVGGYNHSSVSGTKDLQMVNLTLRVLYHPEVDHLIDIYKKLGLKYAEKVFPSIGNDVLRSVVAQFDAEQLVTESSNVSELVRTSLIRRAKEFNIVVDDVAITNLSFGSKFSKAVEQKQVAQQEAERSKFMVVKAEQERKAAIIRAEGERESAKLISEATSGAGMGLIELRKIEAAMDNASIVCRNGKVVYLPSSDNNVLPGANTGH